MSLIFDEIRASDIEDWASQAESERLMPSLIQQLILASGAKVSSCRFITHEKTNDMGWDGVVSSETTGLCVPQGKSVWELSKRRDVARKAASDVQKRAKDSGEVSPDGSTIVIVTLRTWPKRRKSDGTYEDSGQHKQGWASDLASKTAWSAVKVIDAVDIASWIANAPAVGLWFCEVSGKRVSGAGSLIKHWAQLGTLKRGIAPHVFLAGRTVFVQLLDKWLEREPQPFGVQTEASDDLRDAVAAWYSDRVSGANPCALPAVAIRTIDAWNQIAQADRSLILLIDDGLEVSAEQMADATENGHYVIYRTSAVHTSRNGGALPRLNRDALADELQKCGVETTEAWRISGDVGGSGVVLKRMLLGHGPEPTWSKGEGASELAPIVLVGSWDSKNTSDKEVVATLMGQSYEAVEALLRPWIKANDPLVRNNDGQWRVVGREDAWRWLAPFLTDTQISAFEDVALRVLSEINPRFDLPADQRVFAGMRGLVPTHSYRLRKAISESLCLISLRPAFSDGRGSPAISQRIVSKVFDLEGDWRLWASLDHCLVLLAEASPEVVLGALERDLLREVAETPKLFTQAGDDLFADCPHVQLMWSLEALLWDRTTVFRTIVVLARLAARDRGGNMSPRPMGVLRDAFLPWYPQCCMGADDRCRMLDRILAVEPLVGWNLLFELLPRSHDATSPNNRPRYRASEASHEDSEDDAAYRKQIDHVALRLLENVGDDEKRWDKLMGQLARLPQRVFDLVVDELVRRGNDLDEAALYRVWGLLCKIVREHRYFVKAQWLMSERRLVRLEGVIARFEPADPIRRHMWLFAEERPYLPGVNSSISLDEQLEALERTRVDALREVSKEGGVEKILEMAAKQSERQAARMGHMAGQYEMIERDSDVLPCRLNSENTGVSAFARGYATARFHASQWPWLESLDISTWEPEVFGQLVCVLPFSQTAWRFVGGLGTAYENVYWNLAWPWFGNGEDANVERAIRELLARGRGLAALACINSGIVHKLFISARVILDVLSEVRDELLRNEEQPEGQLFTDMDEYVLIEVLSSLQRMEGLTDEELSLGQSLEWSFMPLFKGGGSPELLLKKCSREPEFFVGILESTSWRDGVPKGMRTPRDEQQKARARNSNRLLKFFRRLPGVSSGGELEESAFVSWISEVRRLASQQDLRLSSDRFLGQLFLHSPSDPCGYWPWAPVCEFLSEPSAETVRRALSTAIFNNQGWPGPFGDGMTMSLVSERRKAVEKLKELASLLDFEFPTVAGLLRSQAEAQERSCERFDDEDD